MPAPAILRHAALPVMLGGAAPAPQAPPACPADLPRVAVEGAWGVGADPSTPPLVDSARVARVAWGEARRALQAGDRAAARERMARAATAWPRQPAYLWGLATVAAADGDTAAARRALGALARLGLGADVARDSGVAALAANAAFGPLLRDVAAARAPLLRGRVRATWPDTTFWPEAVTADAAGRLYVGSVRHRTVAAVEPDGTARELWARACPGMGAVLGLRADPRRAVLWVATSGIAQMRGFAPADSAIAAVLRVRARDGVVLERWDLPPRTGGHVLGDLAVAADGSAYVTDSADPALRHFVPGRDTVATLRSPWFRSLQGVAAAPEGATLFVADYSHGLLGVDARAGRVARLTEAEGVTTLGVDGIAWDRGALVAIQNGVSPARVVRFVLDRARRTVVRAELLDRNPAVADEPTIGTVVGRRFVYVANSQWEKHDAAGRLASGAVLAPPVLLAVPLPR